MEYVVGKPKFKTALSYVLGCSMALILLMYFSSATPWQKELNIVLILLIIILFVVVLPCLSYVELMWKVNKDIIQYTYYETIWCKMKAYFIHVFKSHKLEYQVSINLNQIDYIAVTYTKLPRQPFGGIGYDILFELHMYDGSICSFLPLPLNGKKEFNQAVQFIQEQGIHFKDRYQILPELLKDIPISYYLEKVDKENNHA